MKKVKITTIILAIILITLVAFGGVYIETQNRMENKVKSYELGRELKGGRIVRLKVSDGESVEGELETKKPNPEDLTVENYETVKNTLEKRLNSVGVEDYTIALNREDGTIIVELPENNVTDNNVYSLIAPAKIQMKEKDADTELLSDSMVTKARYTYIATTEGAYQAYLELQLNEEGQAKIEEIQNNYAILSNEVEEIEKAQEEAKKEEEKNKENTDNTEKQEETIQNEENQEETKKIGVLTIGGTEYDIERIEKNKIIVKIGGATSNTISVNNNIAKAAELTMLINAGKYPIDYEVENNRFVYSDITEQHLIYIALGIAALVIVALLVFIIKYKTNGLLAGISFIGFVSILSLLLRYTNVSITIEGIGAIIIVLAINFRMNYVILREIKKEYIVREAVISIYKDMFLKLIPIIIITLVFCFSGLSNLSSFGMIMFWGFALIAIYNAVVTKTLLKLKENK